MIHQITTPAHGLAMPGVTGREASFCQTEWAFRFILRIIPKIGADVAQ